MEKIITVSVAIYNMEKYLADCLDSLVKVSKDMLDKCEIILVNDGSCDKSAQIAQLYVNRFPNVFRLISKENGGHGSTINEALKIATGKYFKVLDSDDMFDTDNFSRLLKVLMGTNVDVVINPFIKKEFGSNKNLGVFSHTKTMVNGKIYDACSILDREVSNLTMHATTFKTSVIQNKILLPEHCFYVDFPYLVKSLDLCKDIVYYEFPVYIYRVNRDEQSMSMKGLIKHFNDHEKIMYDMMKYSQDHEKKWIRQKTGDIVFTHFMAMFLLKITISEYKRILDFIKNIEENFVEFEEYLSKPRRYFMKMHMMGYILCCIYTRIKSEKTL